MGINRQTGPEGGEARIAEAFSALTDGPANLFMAEAGGAEPAARVAQPVPIFALDLERLRDLGAEALREARRTGWRYIVEHPSGIEVMDLPEAGGGEPEMLAGGEVARNLVRTGRRAEALAEADADYEPRILDLNLIGNSVLWLHNRSNPGADRFVSLARVPRELDPKALLARLRAAAARKLAAMRGAAAEAGG